ncbi:MAG: STAS domain-containing protein [Thiogranum sp.]
MAESGQEPGPQGNVLRFPEELTIARCGEFHQKFVSRIEQGGDIALDGSAVTRIDTAFIQLLYLVQRTLAEAGCSLQWKASSPAISGSVRLLGMNRQLALPGDT